jgi:cell division protein FtsB
MSRFRSLSIPSKPTAAWWLVVVSGALVIVFTVAIARELIRSQQVRQQVTRLADQVAGEEERHQQLEELIAYLGSQTFQEREARLKLGLRKPGERVIVVPPGSTNSSNVNGQSSTGSGQFISGQTSLPSRWWQFFFGEQDALPNSGQSS